MFARFALPDPAGLSNAEIADIGDRRATMNDIARGSSRPSTFEADWGACSDLTYRQIPPRRQLSLSECNLS